MRWPTEQEEQLQLLLTALGMSSRGFFMLEHKTPGTRTALCARLKREAENREWRLYQVTLSRVSRQRLTDHIANTLTELPADVVLIPLEPQGDAIRFFRSLNLQRESLYDLGAPILFLISRELYPRFLQTARDLSTWIAPPYTFELPRPDVPNLPPPAGDIPPDLAQQINYYRDLVQQRLERDEAEWACDHWLPDLADAYKRAGIYETAQQIYLCLKEYHALQINDKQRDLFERRAQVAQGWRILTKAELGELSSQDAIVLRGLFGRRIFSFEKAATKDAHVMDQDGWAVDLSGLHPLLTALSTQDDLAPLLVIYQNELDSLLDQLQEWKKVGTLLQDLRMNIVLLRSNSFPLSRLKSPLAQRQRRKILREIKIAWQICNRTLHKLKDLAINVHAIGEPYDPETGSGPDWFLSIQRSAAEIDMALLVEDIVPLLNLLFAFGGQVDEFLYLADRDLRYVTSQLRASLLAASRLDVHDEYAESSHQIEAYRIRFILLGEQLDEWLEIHGLLRDLQINFALCRSYTSPLSRFAPSARLQRERMLTNIEVEWRQCRRTFRKLELLASSIRATGEPYELDTGSGPDWFLVIQSLAAKIDKALFAEDTMALPEHLSAFGDQIDQRLYLTDKALSNVLNKINRLSRPNFRVRS